MAKSASSKDHETVVNGVLKCLKVNDKKMYEQCITEFIQLTREEQNKKPKGKKEIIGRYSMLVFRIRDQQGEIIKKDDYDIFLMAGPGYSADTLPRGFFMDKQMNASTSSLIYYLDASKMSSINNGLFGIRVVARPDKGFSYYDTVEYRSEGFPIEKVIAPNETTYIDL